MSDKIKQEEIVFEKWNELINELTILLDIGKKRGGTLGHKIGGMRDFQIKLKKAFESNR